MNEIIVFCGSTIKRSEVLKILPLANCLSPIKNGDIIKAVRLKPKIIIIIDGYFANHISIWHKEILFAISCGITVYGASSMGALRASELSQFGMIGFGEIYNLYDQNIIDGDDEVAVSIYKTNDNIHTSIPLIDIRFTLEKHQHSFTEKEVDSFIRDIKSIGYPLREWDYLLTDKNFTCYRTLINYIKENYINQKLIDAENLLNHVKNNANVIIKQNIDTSDIITVYFRKLYRHYINEPFDHAYDWLPKEEKMLFGIKSKNKYYEYFHGLSILIHIYYDLKKTNKTPLKFISEIKERASTTNTGVEIKSSINDYYNIETNKSDSKQLDINNMFYFLILNIKNLLNNSGYYLNANYVSEITLKFRVSKKLLTKNEFQNWVSSKKFNKKQTKEFFLIYSFVELLNNKIDNIEFNMKYNKVNWLRHLVETLSD